MFFPIIGLISEVDVQRDLTAVKPDSEFGKAIQETIIRYLPSYLLETGTYWGTGSTTIIASTLRDIGLKSMFFSMEVHPKHYGIALEVLSRTRLLPWVTPLWGLSLPRSRLLSVKQIQAKMRHIDYRNVAKDYSGALPYYEETSFEDCPEDLLGKCLGIACPDFVLLDSAGHLGEIEFDYVLSKMVGNCVFAFDDAFSFKHWRSYQRIKKDRRFSIIAEGKERQGFCIASYVHECT